MIATKFATPERPRKLDPYAERLAGWLKAEAGKSRKQRCTVRPSHDHMLCKLGGYRNPIGDASIA